MGVARNQWPSLTGGRSRVDLKPQFRRSKYTESQDLLSGGFWVPFEKLIHRWSTWYLRFCRQLCGQCMSKMYPHHNLTSCSSKSRHICVGPGLQHRKVIPHSGFLPACSKVLILKVHHIKHISGAVTSQYLKLYKRFNSHYFRIQLPGRRKACCLQLWLSMNMVHWSRRQFLVVSKASGI